jgi:predicted XRE-type DNA-binding protein
VKKTKKNYTVARNSKEIALALGIASDAEAELMDYKAKLSSIATKAINNSNMTVNEIVKASGVARSKVSAIKNGALSGISSDLFLKVIAATGTKLRILTAA